MYNKIRLGYHSGFHTDEKCGKKHILKYRCNRTCMMLDNNTELVINKSIKLARQNITELLKILKWNEEHNIKFFRISSDIFPHISNWRLLTDSVLDYKNLVYSPELFSKELLEVGDFAKKHGHRLTFHPGFFTILNTHNKFVLINSIRELWWHTQFLDIMWPNSNSTLTIHIGGVYGDKKAAIETFIENFKSLPDNIKKRVIIENDENNFCVEDLLYINTKISIPICFDYFHYLCWNVYHQKNSKKYGVQQQLHVLLPEILKTWGNKRPKFHISEQMPNKPIGTHSLHIEKIPKILKDLDIDIMLESKCREMSVLKILKLNKFNKSK